MKHPFTSPWLVAALLTAFTSIATLSAAQRIPVVARNGADKTTADKAAADTKQETDFATTINSGDYKVGPGDKLRIEVYKDPQLSQSVQVRPDGKITLPLIGDI